LLLQEGHQHHTDDIREELSALRLGQRRYAVDDRSGGAEDKALQLAASIAPARASSREVSSSSRTLAVMTR
jgi:hypothetical protein